jgi:hypothetical protein
MCRVGHELVIAAGGSRRIKRQPAVWVEVQPPFEGVLRRPGIERSPLVAAGVEDLGFGERGTAVVVQISAEPPPGSRGDHPKRQTVSIFGEHRDREAACGAGRKLHLRWRPQAVPHVVTGWNSSRILLRRRIFSVGHHFEIRNGRHT